MSNFNYQISEQNEEKQEQHLRNIDQFHFVADTTLYTTEHTAESTEENVLLTVDKRPIDLEQGNNMEFGDISDIGVNSNTSEKSYSSLPSLILDFDNPKVEEGVENNNFLNTKSDHQNIIVDEHINKENFHKQKENIKMSDEKGQQLNQIPCCSQCSICLEELINIDMNLENTEENEKKRTNTTCKNASNSAETVEVMVEQKTEVPKYNEEETENRGEVGKEKKNNNCLIESLPCRHRFHKRCLDEWKTRSGTCPNCREPIPGVVSPPDQNSSNNISFEFSIAFAVFSSNEPNINDPNQFRTLLNRSMEQYGIHTETNPSSSEQQEAHLPNDSALREQSQVSENINLISSLLNYFFYQSETQRTNEVNITINMENNNENINENNNENNVENDNNENNVENNNNENDVENNNNENNNVNEDNNASRSWRRIRFFEIPDSVRYNSSVNQQESAVTTDNSVEISDVFENQYDSEGDDHSGETTDSCSSIGTEALEIFPYLEE